MRTTSTWQVLTLYVMMGHRGSTLGTMWTTLLRLVWSENIRGHIEYNN